MQHTLKLNEGTGRYFHSAVVRVLTSGFFAVTAATLLCPTTADAQTSASAYTTGYRYDVASRLTGTIQPDPDGAGASKFAAQRNTYDSQGALQKVEYGELGAWVGQAVAPAAWETQTSFTVFRTVEYSYDIWGRVLTEKLSSAGTPYALTQKSYDSAGNLECVAVRMNPAAYGSHPASACTLGTEGVYGPDRITRYTYNSRQKVLTVRKALGTLDEILYATYTYDPAGTLSTTADAKGNLTTYTYDSYGRLFAQIFPSITTAGVSNVADYEVYTYDKNGNRLTLKKRDGSTITYVPDALNRVVSETYSGNASANVFYTYDLRNLQTSALFGSTAAGTTGLTNTYDGFGQLSSAKTNQSGADRVLNYQYDSEGHRTRITHPDGVAFTYVYDGLNRLNRIFETSTSAVLANITFDAAGRRSILSRGANLTKTTYGYDPVSRLNSLAQDLAGTSQDETRIFSYNPASQVLSRSMSNSMYAYLGSTASGSYTVNGLNQYTQVGTSNATHDLNGNMTSDGCTNYRYDILNRMISASPGTNMNCVAKTLSLAYDPRGRLFQTSGGASGTTQFLYDGEALVAEYSGTGAILRRYVHGSNVDEPLVWYEGGAVGASTRRYMHSDHQGSITAVADWAGTPLFSTVNTYDPYGFPGANNSTRFAYTGQIILPDVGMYYYKARIYNPGLGRFMQTDPIGYKDDFDLYSYVGNDPLNKSDPTGTEEKGPCYYSNCTYIPLNTFEAPPSSGSDPGVVLQPFKPVAQTMGAAISMVGEAWTEIVLTLAISEMLGPLSVAPKTATWGLTISETKLALATAQESYKGSTVVGHALSKHAGKNPEVYGKMSGSMQTWNEQGMVHLREVIRGAGEFVQTSYQNGLKFLEKRLQDGRGVRLNMDGSFKGFLD